MVLEAVRETSSCSFIDGAENIQSSLLAEVMDQLSLIEVETRRNGDHCVSNGHPQDSKGAFYDLIRQHRHELVWGVVGRCSFASHSHDSQLGLLVSYDLDGEVFLVSYDSGVADCAAYEPLEADGCVSRVQSREIARLFPDQDYSTMWIAAESNTCGEVRVSSFVCNRLEMSAL